MSPKVSEGLTSCKIRIREGQIEKQAIQEVRQGLGHNTPAHNAAPSKFQIKTPPLGHAIMCPQPQEPHLQDGEGARVLVGGPPAVGILVAQDHVRAVLQECAQA